jgi:hypothetical protein
MGIRMAKKPMGATMAAVTLPGDRPWEGAGVAVAVAGAAVWLTEEGVEVGLVKMVGVGVINGAVATRRPLALAAARVIGPRPFIGAGMSGYKPSAVCIFAIWFGSGLGSPFIFCRYQSFIAVDVLTNNLL